MLKSRARHAALLVVMVSCLTSGACGYSLAGRGSFLPAYVNTIGIPTFENRTAFFGVEQVLTQKVRAEFIGRGHYKVLPQATNVDAALIGEVSAILVQPSSFTSRQLVSRYVITIAAKIELRDLKTNNVLWANPGVIFREEYDATSSTSALDPNAFFSQEASAIDRVATSFARTVVGAVLEAF